MYEEFLFWEKFRTILLIGGIAAIIFIFWVGIRHIKLMKRIKTDSEKSKKSPKEE